MAVISATVMPVMVPAMILSNVFTPFLIFQIVLPGCFDIEAYNSKAA
jgi:hypothetical protein